jgi:hypothetical protein
MTKSTKSTCPTINQVAIQRIEKLFPLPTDGAPVPHTRPSANELFGYAAIRTDTILALQKFCDEREDAEGVTSYLIQAVEEFLENERKREEKCAKLRARAIEKQKEWAAEDAEWAARAAAAAAQTPEAAFERFMQELMGSASPVL